MARAGFVSRFLKPCAVAACLAVLAACGGGGGGEPVHTVTTVTVTSPTSTPKQGDTVQLTVVARDQFGDVLAGKSATWSTSDATVATISPTGLLQAVAPGTVVVTATIDGLPGSLPLTVVPGAAASVTVTSPTARPQAGETVQLTAVVRDSYGNIVPEAPVNWFTSDAQIATLSAAGLLTALTPGSVVATASVEGVAGTLSLLVVGPPASYFRGDREYGFDYELDAQGRVDSYRIYVRPGPNDPVPPEGDSTVIECTGSLHGDYYHCRRSSGEMHGGGGRLTFIGDLYSPMAPHGTTRYLYNDNGLYSIVSESTDPASPHRGTTHTTTLSYNAEGRPSEVTESLVTGYVAPYLWKGPITTDSQGRLLRAERSDPYCPPGPSCSTPSYVTEWAYGPAGFMEQMVLTRMDYRGVTTAKETTRYEVDGAGWLTARLQRSEGTGSPSESTDTWTVVRSGSNVLEERFTQAEPKAFYGYSGNLVGGVRYQQGRLPSEPLFTPRALTGLKGSDYFGVISSHQR